MHPTFNLQDLNMENDAACSEHLGAVQHKTSAVRREGFFQCWNFSDKWRPSDADVRTFWDKKILIFRNWCVRTDKGGGGSSADILRTTRRGSIFRDFVRKSFMDGPLNGKLLYAYYAFFFMAWHITKRKTSSRSTEMSDAKANFELYYI